MPVTLQDLNEYMYLLLYDIFFIRAKLKQNKFLN